MSFILLTVEAVVLPTSGKPAVFYTHVSQNMLESLLLLVKSEAILFQPVFLPIIMTPDTQFLLIISKYYLLALMSQSF